MTSKQRVEEYLRRNLVQASAEGARGGAKSALTRLCRHRRPPKWLIETLRGIEVRARSAARGLAEWRDEVTP